MENKLDIKDFQSVSSAADLDNMLMVLQTGLPAKVNIAILKSVLRSEIRPYIKDGGSGRYWRVKARFYFSSKDGSSVTLNLADYNLMFYSSFRGLDGQSSQQVVVGDMFGSQSTTYLDVVSVDNAAGTAKIIELLFDSNHIENGYPKEDVRVELVRKSDNKTVFTQYVDFKKIIAQI